MTIREQLQANLKLALLNKQPKEVTTIRLILAAIKDKDIQSRVSGTGMIADNEILSLLQSMVRQREESFHLYQQGGRTDLADGEQAEITIIQQYLPRQLSHEETESIINDAFALLQPNSIKDMGRVMAHLKQNYAGQLQLPLVSEMLKTRFQT